MIIDLSRKINFDEGSKQQMAEFEAKQSAKRFRAASKNAAAASKFQPTLKKQKSGHHAAEAGDGKTHLPPPIAEAAGKDEDSMEVDENTPPQSSPLIH